MIRFDQPIRDGMNRTEFILFPFEFRKWLSLAFCSWLAMGCAGSFSFCNFPSFPDLSSPGHSPFVMPSHVDGWMIGLIVAIGIIILALTVLVIWLSVRGRFMLLDNVVHDKALVVEPWKRLRDPANSLFLFQLILSAVSCVFAILIVAVAAIAFFLHQSGPSGVGGYFLMAILCVASLAFMLYCVYFSWYADFAPPVMYKTGCSATDAAFRVWEIVSAKPLDAILYLLVRIALEIVIVIIAMILGCLTCCIGFLPFVSSFITLPLAVFRQSFILNCLRQLDPALDLWPPAPPPVPEVI